MAIPLIKFLASVDACHSNGDMHIDVSGGIFDEVRRGLNVQVAI